MVSLNELILRWLNEWATSSPAMDAIVIFLARDFGWVLIIGAAIYLGKYYRRTIIVALQPIMSWAIAAAIQTIYSHPRPFLILPEIQKLVSVDSINSFPSGHASFFFALGLALWTENKRLANLYVVGALLISLARVAAGVHWPGDIVGGLFLAVMVTLPLSHWSKRRK